MKEKVLITGASGCLGFHLIEAALEKDLEVYAGVRRTSNIKHLSHLPISFIYPDLSDLKSLTEEVRKGKFDYIIHAAGIMRAQTEVQYNVVNAEYASNMAQAVKYSEIPIKKFVYISSLAALGPLNSLNGMINESMEPKPVTQYGKSKLLSETKLQTLSLPLIILRPTAIYGPRDTQFLILFKSIKRGIEPYIGSIIQRLSFIHVRDMAGVAINALLSKENGAYNISDGNGYSNYDLANYSKLFLKKKTIRFHLPYHLTKGVAKVLEKAESIIDRTPLLNENKINELTGKNWVCSIEKAKNELNFNPLYNLENGIADTLVWYRLHRWL